MTKIWWNPNWFRVVLCLSCFSKRRRTWWGAKFPEYTFPLEREIEPLSFIMESLWKNFETGNRDSRTADLVRISNRGWGIHGPPILSEFWKADAGTHGRSNRSEFPKGKAGIYGLPNRSVFWNWESGIHEPPKRYVFLKWEAGVHGPPNWSVF